MPRQNLVDPRLTGAVFATLASIKAGQTDEGVDEASIRRIVGDEGLAEVLEWLEAAGLVERLGQAEWRLCPDLGNLLDHPRRPPDGEAADVLLAWASTFYGLEGLPNAIAMIRGASELPSAVGRASEELRAMRPSEHALRRFQLGEEFDRLEAAGGADFEIYRRRKLDPDGPIPTLDELGDEFGVRGERVRQRERRFELLLEDCTAPEADSAIEAAVRWVSSRVGLVSAVGVLGEISAVLEDLGLNAKSYPHRMALILRLSGPFERSDAWLMRRGARERLRLAADEAVEAEGTPLPEVVRAMIEVGTTPEIAEELLREDSGFRVEGDTVFPWGASLVDKAETVLRAEGAPLSAREIFDRIGEDKSFRGFKGRLGEPVFLRVGKDLYGLREWGGEEYTTVVAAISADIASHGGLVNLSELVERVSEKFGVAPNSVHVYASGPLFNVVDGQVTERATPALPSGKSLELTASCFRLESGWAERVVVTEDLLRGSGLSISLAFAKHVGVKVDSRIGLESPYGGIAFYWAGVHPAVGSLRKVADAIEAGIGDLLFLEAVAPGRLRIHHVSRAAVEGLEGVERVCAEAGVTPVDGETGVEAACVAVGLDRDRANASSLAHRLRERGLSALAGQLDSAPSTDDSLVEALRGLGG